MIEELKTKTQPVRKEQVWSAWKHIRKGGKGMGIDQVSLQEIDANPRKYLYVIVVLKREKNSRFVLSCNQVKLLINSA